MHLWRSLHNENFNFIFTLNLLAVTSKLRIIAFAHNVEYVYINILIEFYKL
jgi:hypothetical protein